MFKIGTVWALKWSHMSKFGKIVQIFFYQKFLKIISVRFMDIILVKNVINGSIWSKQVIFGENVQNSVFLGAKLTPYIKIWGKWSKNYSVKVSKNYFSQFYGHNFGLKCHSWGQFGQNRSFFGVFLYFLVKMPIPRRYFRNDVPFFVPPIFLPKFLVF